jgi:hypothetical protein
VAFCEQLSHFLSLGDYLYPFCLRFSCIYACMNRASHVALEVRGWPWERVSINISAEKSSSPSPTCAKRSRLARPRELSLVSAVVVSHGISICVCSFTLSFCRYCISETLLLMVRNNVQNAVQKEKIIFKIIRDEHCINLELQICLEITFLPPCAPGKHTNFLCSYNSI